MSAPHRGHRLLTVHLPFLLVLGVVAVGVLFVAIERWRRGATLLGLALLLGALLRAGLGEQRAGLLAVRGKPTDVLTYAGLGIAIIVLASSVDSLGTD